MALRRRANRALMTISKNVSAINICQSIYIRLYMRISRRAPIHIKYAPSIDARQRRRQYWPEI